MDLTNIPEIVKIRNILFKNDMLNKTLELVSIFYKSDDIVVQGFILQKRNLDKKIPVIIFCRGGNNGKHPVGEITPKSLQVKELIYLAENEKAIIFYPNYRGSSMSEGKDEFGGEDVNDIISLYPIISKYKYCDNKITLYGWSRGGMMAIKVATIVPWVIKIILGGSPYSITRAMRERPNMKKLWLDEFHLTKDDILERAPKYLMHKIPSNIPILILHGSADTAVSVSHAYSLAKKCQKYNILYKLIIFPNGDHQLSQYTDDVAREVIEWII